MERYRRLLLRALPALGALAVRGAAAAGTAAPVAGCTRPIVVAASPIGRSVMIAPSGQVSGVTRDLLDQVAQATGCQFDYQVMPRARAFVLFNAGDIDIIPSVTRSAARDAVGTFVKTHAVRPMLISLRKRKLAVRTIAELLAADIRFDVVRGWEYGPSYAALLDQAQQLGRVQFARDPEIIARKLAAGRMDAALLPPSTFVEAAEQLDLSARLEFSELGGIEPVEGGIYLARNHLPAADANRIQQSIEALVIQGEFERLQRHYYAQPEWASKGLQFYTGHTKR